VDILTPRFRGDREAKPTARGAEPLWGGAKRRRVGGSIPLASF
jgi:hypothetical protein